MENSNNTQKNTSKVAVFLVTAAVILLIIFESILQAVLIAKNCAALPGKITLPLINL